MCIRIYYKDIGKEKNKWLDVYGIEIREFLS